MTQPDRTHPRRRPVPAPLLVALSVLAAPWSAAHAQDDAAPGADGQARALYLTACARCHGVDGGGGEGPPLARAHLPRAPDDESLMLVIVEGIEGTAMPPTWWLSEGELGLVARYVRSLAPTGAGAVENLPGDPVRGRTVYEEAGCGRCHTVGGYGTARGPDLTTVGARRGASYLREAVLDPAASLPRGLTAMPTDFVDYLPVRVVDAEGTPVSGVRVNEDSYTIQIRDRQGTVHSFYKPALRDLVKEYDRSLMRSYRDRLTQDQVDDLVAYLATLTGAAPRGVL